MPVAEVQPLTVTVTLYTPLAAGVALAIVGFCCDELNPFGPVQLYVAPATVDAVRLSVEPAQISPSLPAIGAVGTGLTVMRIEGAFVVAGAAQPALEVNWQSI